MEYLRALLSGPSQVTASLAGPPAPVAGPARASESFAEALFEEGARAGPPQNSLARQVAALDSQERSGMGDRLALDLDRREFARQDSVPESDLTFGDLVDVVNPLQHIPIVANIYRSLTGDTISGPARVAGGALYGGPFGMLAGIANAIAVEVGGNDLGGSLIASIVGESPPADTLLAEAAPAQAANTAPLTASFAPQPQTRVLTGDAALGALLGDLRATSAVPMELPVLAPALSAPGTSDGAAPQRGEDRSASAHGFTDQMMLGLDKYRAQTIERGGPGRPALDRRL